MISALSAVAMLLLRLWQEPQTPGTAKRVPAMLLDGRGQNPRQFDCAAAETSQVPRRPSGRETHRHNARASN
jgi:hypothetical protein